MKLEDKEKKSVGVSILTASASIVSVVSIGLAMLGLGFQLAVDSVFSLPGSSISSSFLDLVDISKMAVMVVFGAGPKIFSVDFFLIILKGWWVFLLVCFSIWVLVLVSINRKLGFVVKVKEATVPWLSWPKPHESYALQLRSLIWVPIAVVFMVMSSFMMAILFFLLLFSLSFIPIFGYEVGKKYFIDYVINPVDCFPVINGSDRRKMYGEKSPAKNTSDAENLPYGVMCVSLSRDGKLAARGRVVLSSPSAIVVFNSITGDVYRESLSGLSLRAVSTEQDSAVPNSKNSSLSDTGDIAPVRIEKTERNPEP